MTTVTASVTPLTDPTYSNESQVTAVAGDAADGYTIANTGHEIVVLYQSGSTSRTIVLTGTGQDGVARSQTFTLSATASKLMPIGPFSVRKWGTSIVLTPSHAEVLFATIGLDKFGEASGTAHRASGVVVGGM